MAFGNKYASYTSDFRWKNPFYDRGSSSVSSETIDLMANAYKRKYAFDPYEERTGLNRAFDTLLLPNYAVAGFVKGLVDNGQENDISPWQGAWRGIKAGNPFGDGYHQGRTSFSDVLETAGWKPTNTFGKIAKGVAGFVLDVALDPTTYLSGGASALIKGTGRVGLKAFERAAVEKIATKHGITDIGNVADLPGKVFDLTLEKYSGKGYDPDLVSRMAKFNRDEAFNAVAPTMGGMNREMAKDIINLQNFKRATKASDEQIAKDADTLMNRYNKIVGIRDSSRFNMKLSNAPFGDKLFGWTGIADKSLFDIDTMGIAKWSEKMKISSAYSTLRRNIYGTQFGRLFSNNAKLYQLSKADPGTMFDYISAMDKFQGLKLEKSALETAVKEEAERLKLDLEPSDMKAVLKLMQNKKDWKWLTRKIKYSETKEGMEILSRVEGKKKLVEDELADLTKMREEVEALLENDARTVKANQEGIEQARFNIDGFVGEYRKRVRRLRMNLLQNWDLSTRQKNYWMEQLNGLEDYTSIAKHRTEVGRIDVDRVIGEYLDSRKTYRDHRAEIERLRNSMIKQPYKGDILEGWQHSENKRVYDANAPIRKQIRDLEAQNVSFIPQKESLVKQLSKYFFDDEHVISRSAPDDELDNIIGMIGQRSEKEIGEVIKNNINVYNGRTRTVNQFIGQMIGYGKDLKYKNWQEYYHARVNPIKEKKANYDRLKSNYLDEIYELEKRKKKVFDSKTIDRLKNEHPRFKMIDGTETIEKYNMRIAKENKIIDEHIAEIRARMRTHDGLLKYRLTPAERTFMDKMEKERMIREEMRDMFKLAKTDDEVNSLMADFLDDANMKDFLENPATYHSERFQSKSDNEKWRNEQLDNDSASTTSGVAKKVGTYGDGTARTEIVNTSTTNASTNPYDKIEYKLEFSHQDERQVLEDMMSELRYGNWGNETLELVKKTDDHRLKVTRTTIDKLRTIIKEVPDILRNTFKQNYTNLTPDQRLYLFDKALTNYELKMSGKNASSYAGDEAKKIREIMWGRLQETRIANIEEKTKVGSYVSWIEKDVKVKGQKKQEAVYIDDYKPARIVGISSDPDTKRRLFKLAILDDDGKVVRTIDNVDGRELKGVGSDRVGTRVDWNERKLKTPAQDEIPEEAVESWRNAKVIEIGKDEHGGSIYTVVDRGGNTMQVKPYQLKTTKPPYGLEKTADEIIESQKKIDNMEFLEDIAHEENYIRDMLKNVEQKEKDMLPKFKSDKSEALKGLLERQKSMETAIKDMEATILDINKKVYDDIDYPQIEKLSQQIEKMTKVLNDDDALEAYMRANPHYGDAHVDEAKSRFTLAFLDAHKDYNSKVVETATFLKEKFAAMAEVEVKIGKLKREQVDKMVDRYVPHILTDAGEAFFRQYKFAEDVDGNLIAVEKTLDKDATFLTQDLGYGKVWNPYGMKRTFRIKTDKLNKNGNPIWIKNPTIEQINEYLTKFPDIMDKLKGNPLFSEDIADIFLQRGLRNLELFYDHRYMETMMHNFGWRIDNFDDLEKGYKAVVNVTKMKNTIGKVAHERLMKEFSAEASEERSQAYKEIGRRANKDAFEEVKAIGRREIRDKYKAIDERADKLVKEHLSRMAKDYLREQRARGIKGNIKLPKVQRDMYQDLFKKYKEDIIAADGTPTYTPLNEAQKKAIYDDKFAKIIQKEGEPQITPKEPEEYTARLEQHYEEVTLEMGFKPAMLNEAATPMLELQKHQFNAIRSIVPEKEYIANDGIIRAVNEAIVQKANQSRQIQIARDSHKTLKLFDKFTHWFKLNQTTVLPSFHMRNGMSNLFLTWLAVGRDAFNMNMHVSSIRTIRSNGTRGTETFKRLENGQQIEMTWNEAFEKAVQYGVVDKGFFAVEMGAQDASKGFMKFLGKYDPSDTKNFPLYKGFDPNGKAFWVPIGAEFGNMIENGARLQQFVSHLKLGKSYEQARDLVAKYLFDYSDITAFEANVMKRIIPFYVWMRKNARLQLGEMLEQPGKYQLMAKYTQGIQGMNNQEDRMNFNFVNEFAKDWIQLPFHVRNEEGRLEPVMFNPALPYMDLSRIPNPLKPGESFRNLVSSMNPQFKIPFEQLMNKQYFFQQPLVEGKDGESPTVGEQIKGRTDHTLSHLSMYNAGKDIFMKSGLDWGLEVFAVGTGVKALSYDYDKFKWQVMKERVAEPKSLGDRGWDALVAGFEGAYYAVKDLAANAVDSLNSGRPMEAGSYTGALAPISKMKYNSLSEEEKKKYTPPTNGEVLAFNMEAKRLEEEALAKTGQAKKFIWTLLDSVGMGEKRNFTIGHVTHVADGDTFTVMVGDQKKTVRMLLVDTPETVKPDTPEQPFGKDASNKTKKFLIDKEVRLTFEPNAKEDDFGRLLAYVEVDGIDYNKQLIEEGYGKYRYNYGNYSRAPEYLEAERSAYSGNKGIWQLDGYADLNYDSPYHLDYNLQQRYKKLLESMSK